MGDAFTVSTQPMSTHDNDAGGTHASVYLRNLKSFAKGNLDKVNQTGADASIIDSTNGGSDGEELHSGDLFQIVHVPADGAIDLGATESETSLVRFVYIGHLSSDAGFSDNIIDEEDNLNPFSCKNTLSYSGTPAYSFGHVNDSDILYRIKTTSKNSAQVSSRLVPLIMKDSEGNDIESSYRMVDQINLADALGVQGFEISTMAECKSADGDGNFGGDTTNKNNFMGYGKLWIANKNDHNKIYLVDITNWDGIDADENKITFKEITLNFERIHSTLISKDDTTFGEGLLRLWSGDRGDGDKQNLIRDYAFNNIPEEKYISSICETYSHKPHLGDDAGGGVEIGDGKWRVWVSYNNKSCIIHRY